MTTLEAQFHDKCFETITISKDKKICIKDECAGKIKWFSTSGNLICSLCNKEIKEDECPIRLWRTVKP